MSKKFKKNPIIIEAIQWLGNNFEELEEFSSERNIVSNQDGTLTIETLEGNHIAKKKDWIIRGIKGEIYPCKPDIFEKTYQEIKEISKEEVNTLFINSREHKCDRLSFAIGKDIIGVSAYIDSCVSYFEIDKKELMEKLK